MVANDVTVPLSFIARLVCRIQINSVCRTKFGDVDHNGLRPCQCKMRHTTGLGVEAARRQRLCGGGVGHAAKAKIPCARHHDSRTIIAMRVRLDGGVGRDAEANGVEPWFRGIPQEHGCLNSSHTGGARTGAAGFPCCDLLRCQANLIDGRCLHRARQDHDQHDSRNLLHHALLRACAFYSDRKFTINVVVALGFSSMIQCPEPGTMPVVTYVATKRMVSACAFPNDFSPPRASTGIGSLPSLASSALLSMASWLNAPNCSNASCIACGLA